MNHRDQGDERADDATELATGTTVAIASKTWAPADAAACQHHRALYTLGNFARCTCGHLIHRPPSPETALYAVVVRNTFTGVTRRVQVTATGPEQARADALHWCFRNLAWRTCTAARPGQLVTR